MKTQVVLLLFASVAFVLANEHSTGRPELNIDGIPQTAIAKLQEMMRNATTLELRRAAINQWENSLPSDQQVIAKAFFTKWEQQHAGHGTTPQ